MRNVSHRPCSSLDRTYTVLDRTPQMPPRVCTRVDRSSTQLHSSAKWERPHLKLRVSLKLFWFLYRVQCLRFPRHNLKGCCLGHDSRTSDGTCQRRYSVQRIVPVSGAFRIGSILAAHSVIHSGPLKTPLLMDFLNTPEKLNRRMNHLPMGRFGEAIEQARAVLFLGSDESSYITGMDFLVDGGLSSCYVVSDFVGGHDSGVAKAVFSLLFSLDPRGTAGFACACQPLTSVEKEIPTSAGSRHAIMLMLRGQLATGCNPDPSYTSVYPSSLSGLLHADIRRFGSTCGTYIVETGGLQASGRAMASRPNTMLLIRISWR
jgi:hypothetical protein